MSDYIKREDAVNAFRLWVLATHGHRYTNKECAPVFASIPSADVVPKDFHDKTCEAMAKRHTEEMQRLLSKREWIPCSERLPEYRELVNVTTRDLRVKLAYLDSIQEDGTDDFWEIPLDDASCAVWNIIAWMPLPEPYKEGE